MIEARIVLPPATLLLVAVFGGLWRFAGFRGDMQEKWQDRIDIARAGLAEKAADELRQLRNEVGKRLGVGRPFDPLKVIGDPAELVVTIDRLKRLLSVRDSAGRCLDWLLRLGYVLVGALLLALVGIVLTTILLLSGPPFALAGAWLLATVVDSVSILGLIGSWLFYAYAQHRLSQAVILAK